MLRITVTSNLLLIFMFSVAPDLAKGNLVYEQPLGAVNARSTSDVDFPQIVGDEFPLAGQTIGLVRWQGVYAQNDSPTTVDDFTIRFFDDNGPGGLPGSLLNTISIGNTATRTDTGFDLVNSGVFDLYEYEASVGSINLGTGTFWISIVNDTSADSNDDWNWAARLESGSGTYVIDNNSLLTSPSTHSNVQFAFALEAAAIPEPSAFAMFAVVASMACRRRFLS